MPDLQLEHKGSDWIHLVLDRDKWRGFVKTLMNHWVPQIAGNYFTSRETISFSRMTLNQSVCLILRDFEIMRSCIIIIIIIIINSKRSWDFEI
jgi:hypothetical protein